MTNLKKSLTILAVGGTLTIILLSLVAGGNCSKQIITPIVHEATYKDSLVSWRAYWLGPTTNDPHIILDHYMKFNEFIGKGERNVIVIESLTDLYRINTRVCDSLLTIQRNEEWSKDPIGLRQPCLSLYSVLL